MLSEERLAAIADRAQEVLALVEPVGIAALTLAEDDVPALLTEIRTLRALVAGTPDAPPLTPDATWTAYKATWRNRPHGVPRRAE